jgi:trk system potassium uptake protein TrkH
MSLAIVAHCLGWFALAFSAVALLPVLPAVGAGDMNNAGNFLGSAILSAFASCALVFATRGATARFGKNECYLVVVLVWPLLALLGAVPLYVATDMSFWQAVFESVSGLTTTGSSIFDDPGSLPTSILFWRALLHWTGGFVTVLLAIVVLSFLGGGGMQQFESALAKGEGVDIPTRLAQTARDLSWVYIVLTLICAVTLWICGVAPMEGLALAFGAMSTGGFEFRDGGVAALNNWPAELVLAMFMLIGAMNMTQHWALMHARLQGYRRAVETRYFLGVVLVVIVVLGVLTWMHTPSMGLGSLRAGMFQGISILTTTGMTGAADTAVPMPAILIIGLVLIGGCAGSTAGGMKLFRVAVLFKQAQRELARLCHPHGVRPLRIARQTVAEATIGGVWNFFFLMVLSIAGVSALLAAIEMPAMPAIATTIATISNAGPLAGAIHGGTPPPSELSTASQAVLVFAMVVGRVELVAFFTLLNPAYWRQ